MNSGTTASEADATPRSGSTQRSVGPPGDEIDDASTTTARNGTGDADTPDAEPAESDPDQLPLDLVFTVLKNQRRRRVLAYLREEEGPVSLSDLSEYIAAKENDTTPAALGSQERKRAYVGLYQCHLPMMDDAGIVAFNKDRGLVELEELASTLDPYLEVPTAAPTPWPAYYLVLALIGVIATAVSIAVAAIPPGLVGGVVAGAVGGLALVHSWREWAPADVS